MQTVEQEDLTLHKGPLWLNPAPFLPGSYLQVRELREGFIAARLDAFVRPIARVDSAGAIREVTLIKRSSQISAFNGTRI